MEGCGDGAPTAVDDELAAQPTFDTDDGKKAPNQDCDVNEEEHGWINGVKSPLGFCADVKRCDPNGRRFPRTRS